MKELLKAIWFMGVIAALGISWMLCSMMALGKPPYFITDPETKILVALLAPGAVFVLTSHLCWMFMTGWAITERPHFPPRPGYQPVKLHVVGKELPPPRRP